MKKVKTNPEIIIRKIEIFERLKKAASQSSFNKIILLTQKKYVNCSTFHRGLYSHGEMFKTLSYIQIGRIILYRVEDIIAVWISICKTT
jgi:hypothetical protein